MGNASDLAFPWTVLSLHPTDLCFCITKCMTKVALTLNLKSSRFTSVYGMEFKFSLSDKVFPWEATYKLLSSLLSPLAWTSIMKRSCTFISACNFLCVTPPHFSPVKC
jgi:hypothetical protein